MLFLVYSRSEYILLRLLIQWLWKLNWKVESEAEFPNFTYYLHICVEILNEKTEITSQCNQYADTYLVLFSEAHRLNRHILLFIFFNIRAMMTLFYVNPRLMQYIF
jgi:hypothetical protein